MQWNPQRPHAGQRHRHCQRDGTGHNHRRPPLHEQQGHHHNHRHRLEETTIEMTEPQLHRSRLIGKCVHLHSSRQGRHHTLHRRPHLPVKPTDCPAGLHFHRQQNRPLPGQPVIAGPAHHIDMKWKRSHIAAAHIEQRLQTQRLAVCTAPQHQIAKLALAA